MENTGNPLGAFAKAVAFAADKHRNQRRKCAEASPYINHPIALANEGGIDHVTVLCAAVLHDTIEDAETTSEKLQAIFRPKVTSGRTWMKRNASCAIRHPSARTAAAWHAQMC